MRVGEARALEIGHRVRLAPYDIVEDPISLILQRGADAGNIVIAADHPDAAAGFQDALRLLQPGMGEALVSGEAVELVPIIVRSDERRVGKASVGTCRYGGSPYH